MLTPNEAPKRKKILPHCRGGNAVPVERLMDHYSKAPEVKLKARKAITAGKRTKLGITRFLFEVFRQNELLPRQQKLTNNKIAAMLLEEYPNQEALHRGLRVGGKLSVNDYRRRYNSGTLVRDVLPERCSFRYNEQGFPVDSRNGRRVLTIDDQRKIWEGYKSKFSKMKRPARTLPDVTEPPRAA